MEKNIYVFGGKTAKFKATKRYVRFENFPSFIHCSDTSAVPMERKTLKLGRDRTG